MTETTRDKLQEVTDQVRQIPETLGEIIEKAASAARGTFNRTSDAVSGFFQELVDAGEKVEKQRKTSGKKATADGGLRARVREYLDLPAREDIEALNKKLNTLSRKLRKLEKEAAGA